MTDRTIELDQHRGMAAQKATDLRRLRVEVEADQQSLRARRDSLETKLMAGRRPAGRRRSRRRATCSRSSPRRRSVKTPAGSG
jgi:hypothetical protein